MSLRVVLFDMNGTLLDPAGIAEPLGGAEDGLGALDEAVTAAMAETLSGGYRPLAEFLRMALVRRGEVAGWELSRLDEALDRAARMPPYPDAAEALERLRAAGLRTGVLTNSGTEAAERALGAAGLLDRVELVAGADAVEAFKPDPRVYRHGLERAGAAPHEACMVAAHWWDLLGASRAGMRTAWVARKETVLVETLQPDLMGAGLSEVAAKLAATPD
jgi:2-haloacid dehalogenase